MTVRLTTSVCPIIFLTQNRIGLATRLCYRLCRRKRSKKEKNNKHSGVRGGNGDKKEENGCTHTCALALWSRLSALAQASQVACSRRY